MRISRTLARTMTGGTQVGEIPLPRRPVAECLVGSQGVIGMPEAVDLDRLRDAVADDRPKQVLVLQGAEELFDDAVGLWAPHSGSDVPEQRVVAGERVSQHSPAEAWAVECR
jgi:hypothetical protein